MTDERDSIDPRITRAAEVIRLEARTIANLEGLLDERFLDAFMRINSWR